MCLQAHLPHRLSKAVHGVGGEVEAGADVPAWDGHDRHKIAVNRILDF